MISYLSNASMHYYAFLLASFLKIRACKNISININMLEQYISKNNNYEILELSQTIDCLNHVPLKHFEHKKYSDFFINSLDDNGKLELLKRIYTTSNINNFLSNKLSLFDEQLLYEFITINNIF